MNDGGLPGELRAKPSAAPVAARGTEGGAAYSDHVSPSWTSVLAGFVGLVVGALAVLAFRASERERLPSPGQPGPPPPPRGHGAPGGLRSAAPGPGAGGRGGQAPPPAGPVGA